ncbi:hypothetical protein BH11PSE11_BH11PSE11_26650 [soil metagenome]
MSILRIAGNFLAALGFLCGVFLLLSPFNAVAAWGLLLSGKTLALGGLFLFLSWLGLMLGGLGDGGKAAADRLLFCMGAGWLALGILAIVALIAHLVGLVPAEGTMIWWLVAAVGTVMGGIAVTMGSDARRSSSRSGNAPAN